MILPLLCAALASSGSSDSAFADTLCGWLRCGYAQEGSNRNRLRWVVLPGSTDTLRDFNHRIRHPGWKPRVPANPAPLSWVRIDSSCTFKAAFTDSCPKGLSCFFPEAKALRWRFADRIWQLAPERKLQWTYLPPGVAPPSYPSDLVWSCQPPLFPAKSTQSVAGLGLATWTGTYRWSSPDTLVALAKIRPDKSRQHLLGTRVLDVGIPFHASRSGGKLSLQAVPGGAFSLLTLPRRGDGLLGGLLASKEELFVVSGDSSHWRLSVDTSEQGDVIDSSIKVDPSARLFWSDEQTIRKLASADFDPKHGPLFEAGLAPLLSKEHGITFAVSPVDPDTSRLPRADESQLPENQVAGNPGSDSLIQTYGSHAFLDAFTMAWNNHRPIRVSPDAVWMLLLQGLATRIVKHPETCRQDLVRHASGKKDVRLFLTADQFANIEEDSTWQRIAAELLTGASFQLKSRLDTLLVPQFSTTTPTRALATRLQLLQAISPFFDYRALAACGIPRITLEGSPADWRRLRERTAHLGICGLRDWTAQVLPVLDEFVRTAEGSPSLAFWRSFVRYTPSIMCGEDPVVDGWITALFPVDASGNTRHFLSPLETGSVPSDRGTFPFTIQVQGTSDEFEYSVVSGYSGIGQAADGTLFPELGWSVLLTPRDK